jgi:hypothetical protein
LGKSNTSCFFYAAQRSRPIAIISRNNDSNNFALPVLSQEYRKTVITSGHPLGFDIGLSLRHTVPFFGSTLYKVYCL